MIYLQNAPQVTINEILTYFKLLFIFSNILFHIYNKHNKILYLSTGKSLLVHHLIYKKLVSGRSIQFAVYIICSLTLLDIDLGPWPMYVRL